MTTAENSAEYRLSNIYADMCNTLTIRLSELIFGSLVAAYILGFIAIADLDGLLAISNSASCLAICVSFAYLTTAMYLHYHCGILTMPTMALESAGLDFSFALGQGVLFGICMIRPAFFPVCVSIALLLSIWRQSFERSVLVGFLTDLWGTSKSVDWSQPRRHRGIGKERRVKVVSLLSKHYRSGSMTVWAPVSRWTVAFAWMLLLGGGLYAIEDVAAFLGRPLPQLDGQVSFLGDLPTRAVATAIGAWLLCVLVVIRAQGILRRGGALLSKDSLGKLEREFAALVRELRGKTDE